MQFIDKLRFFFQFQKKQPYQLDHIQMALGRIEWHQRLARNTDNLRDYEFKVYSQWGEDGIIQFLIHRVPVEHPIFVEFGVQDYTESNTRFLLQNNNWSGLVIDGSPEYVRRIKSDTINLRYNLQATCAFIDRDNINTLIRNAGITGDIGLLSVDIDGNDYWVWEAIDCVSPRIVVCEYNSLFGPTRKVTVPYDKNFVRDRAHFSYLYYGASIAALDYLAQKKGYACVGSNSRGNNVFFVRRDVLGALPTYTAEQAYVQAQFRESRNSQGKHTYLTPFEQRKHIADMPVIDLESHNIEKAGSL
jgi:hypothetical protein